jgi:hypothetical protein
MRLFWTTHQNSGDNPRAYGRPTGVDGNGPSGPFNDDDVTVLVEGVFNEEDWDEIVNLLWRDNQLGSSSQWGQSKTAVTSSLAELRASSGQQIVALGPVLARLLDLWALVHRVDPLATRPLESPLAVGPWPVTTRPWSSTTNKAPPASAWTGGEPDVPCR